MSVIIRLKNKYNKIPLPVKASIWFVFCSILQKGISLFTVPIFTRLLSTEEYGVYSTYLSWYQILLIFTSLNLFHGVFNNAMIKFENKKEQYISSMQGLVTVITAIFFAIYIVFHNSINDFLGMTTPLVLLLFVELLVTPALQFWMVHNRFDYKYKPIVIITLAKSLANPVLGIFFVLHSNQKDLARIFSVVLVEFCVCGIIVIYQFYKGHCFFNKEFWNFAILFNLPLIPHYLSGSILNQGDRIMIGKIVGQSEVAFYSVAYNIGILVNIITNAIISSLTPWMYQKIKENRATEIKKIVNILLLFMASLIMLLILFAPEALFVIASPEYYQAVYVIPPVAASTFFYFMYNIFANIEFYYEERKFVLIGSILAATFNILLNWIFIPILGYYAAGYTTLVCYIIYGLSHLGFSKFVVNKNMKGISVFDSKTILAVSFVVIIFTIGLNFLYANNLLRYCFIGIIFLLVIIKRKSLIRVVQMLNFKKSK